MKLTLVVAAIYALAVETALVAAGRTCNIGPSGLTESQKATLRTCHNQYDPWTWNGQNCGGKGWFRGHDPGWQSPNDCKSLCSDCINSAINAGSTSVECWWTSSPAVRCWTGYN